MNENISKRIREEDTRALGKFAIIIIISMFVGGILGALSIITKYNLADIIKAGAINFLTVISPYASLAVTAITAIIVYILYRKCMAIYRKWDGENEDDINHLESLLSYALWFSSLNVIMSYFFFAAGLVLIMGDLDPYNVFDIIRFLFLFGGIVVTAIVITIEQQKIINFEKIINPEKKGSVFDMRFAKKWEESCDEAEKLTIYKCAYKSYQTVNMTCLILWVLCILGSFIWDIGILPVAIVTIIWIVSTSSYSFESIRLAKKPSMIHK